jgi:hypothetical protein
MASSEENLREKGRRGKGTRRTFLNCVTWAPYFGSLSSLIVLSNKETWVIAILVRELLPVGLLVLGLAAALSMADWDACGG